MECIEYKLLQQIRSDFTISFIKHYPVKTQSVLSLCNYPQAGCLLSARCVSGHVSPPLVSPRSFSHPS